MPFRTRIFLLLATLGVLTLPGMANAQQTAKVVSPCNSVTYVAGTTNYVTIGTDGGSCTSATGGGGGIVTGNQSNAGAGTTGSTNLGVNSYNYGWNGSGWIQETFDASGRVVAVGAGVAGTPAGGVLSIQGVGGGTAIPVTISGNPAINLAQIAGAAPSLTNPIWIANAEAGDTTGTFTNATQTTAISNSNADGYATALVSIHGTYAGATGTFLQSDDGGTTTYPVLCYRTDGTGSEIGYTALTNTSRQWVCPISGNDTVVVQSSAVTSGTVSVRIGITSPSPGQVGSATVQGQVADGIANTSNPVMIGGTNDGTAGGLANIAKVDANGNLFVSVGAVSTTGTVVSFRQTTTASAVVLASNAATNGYCIKALAANTGTVAVGGSGVLTTTGYPLAASESVCYSGANSNQSFIIGNGTDIVAVTVQ